MASQKKALFPSWLFRLLFFLTSLVLTTSLVMITGFCPPVQASEPALQKPGTYKSGDDIAGWVMSEKLDGVRGYWNGEKLLTRKGNPLNPPAWFTSNFPPFELDGELWSKRADFEFVQSTVLDQNPGEGWAKITYNIFEVPNAKGDFFSRLYRAQKWFKAHENQYVRVIPQEVVTDKSHLDRFLNKIEAQGGEGIILKNPKMEYHTGRSPHILKVKNFQDMEGIVTKVNNGKGKYKGMMGSLTLKLENEVIFKLGTGFSDLVRKNPPQPGTVVTFKYYGFTKNNIPKFASFLRVRGD